jgi:hypothetical protein
VRGVQAANRSRSAALRWSMRSIIATYLWLTT